MLPVLQSDDSVRIIAPCGAFDRTKFDAGLSILKQTGLNVVYDEGIFSKHRYLAGTDERRLNELQAALYDDSVQAIWIARAGYGLTRILHKLEVPKHLSKLLIGFSDATALHAVWKQRGQVSWHGPNITTLESWSAEARQALWNGLFQAQRPTLKGKLMQGQEDISGILWGGNLTTLASMLGSNYFPNLVGCILFLEDIGEVPYRLDRYLTQLLNANALYGVTGIVVGQLTDCKSPENSYSALDVFMERLSPLGIPILVNVPVGHDPTSWPILLGAPARISIHEQSLKPV